MKLPTPLLAFLASLTVIVYPTIACAGEQFFVVVNAENKISNDSETLHRTLRRIYLKEITSWPNGDSSIFFARPEQTLEEQVFRQMILNMDDDALQEYWTRLKQIKGETPPRAVSSTRILLRQLQRKTNAVGVISKNEFDALAGADQNLRIVATLGTE